MLRLYRENFNPSIYMKEPKSMLAIGVITAETEEEAHTHLYTPEEEMARNYNKDRFVIGSVDTVAQRLRELAKEALIDEVMIADFYPNQAARVKAYQLLGEEFNQVSK
jgi:alkanesulfonate monooxygenase SsuD/methylene tetrahydromethanopterin reductase-like flavin-dependent oxidoreductase (luciferase family)